ncbi:MAG: metallopeptidase family protein [Chloroflexota bacterium]
MPVRRRAALAHRHPRRRAPDPWQDRPGDFERVVQEALDGLPAPFRALLANVAVVVEDLPTPDQARAGDSTDGWLYGLYDGTPATEPWSDHVVAPNVITLFRVPLQEDFRHPDELVWEIQRTVIHELAHHAGIDDDRLAELGYD